MKIVKVSFSVLILFVFMLLSSCSENSTNTDDNSNKNSVTEYFPLSIGNWWSHTNYVLDDNGDRTEYSWNDSVWVLGNEEKYGKNTTVLLNFYIIQGKENIDTNYYNLDGSKIYQYIPSGNPSKEGKWQLLFDSDSQEWVKSHIEDVFRDTLTYPISEFKDTTIYKARTKIDEQVVTSIAPKDFELKGKTVNALGFSIIQYSSDIETYNGVVKSDFADTTNISTFYIAKNIGIVHDIKSQFSPQSHNVVHFEQVLNDYHVVMPE